MVKASKQTICTHPGAKVPYEELLSPAANVPWNFCPQVKMFHGTFTCNNVNNNKHCSSVT